MTSTTKRVVDSSDDAGREAEHTDWKVEPLKFEVADYLDTPEMLAGYLSEFVNEDDPRMLLEALRTACKAKGMVDVAMKAGLARESLYKALKPDSRPRMETFLAVIKALDLKLVVLPISNDYKDQSGMT
jgi:probable addiction module antidote protein